MSAAHVQQITTPASASAKLYLSFDLGWSTWSLAFTTGVAQKPRLKTIAARDLNALAHEIQLAKVRFDLPDDTPTVSCYEAGRDGFWLHRFLVAHNVANVIVDASSIEVNRRARRAKSDRLDVAKLLTMLMRYHEGEATLWSVVNVPTPEAEDLRQPERELITLREGRTSHINRIKGLLASLGFAADVDKDLPQKVEGFVAWSGDGVPAAMKGRILREFERWKLVDSQIRELEKSQRQAFREEATVDIEKLRQLLEIRGIGTGSATLFVREFFGWREIKNRRELASLAGLAPTPYSSGESRREQGISKAGNRRLRWMMVEIAWSWLRWQPESGLSLWYQSRFGAGNARSRKVGIVALARKLLIALWKYLEQGEVPEGAELVPWQRKLGGSAAKAKPAA